MNRRDALKSLAALAGATGISVTPVTTHEAAAVTMVILKPTTGLLSKAGMLGVKDAWSAACAGTDLEHVRAVVLGGNIDVEFVRGHD